MTREIKQIILFNHFPFLNFISNNLYSSFFDASIFLFECSTSTGKKYVDDGARSKKKSRKEHIYGLQVQSNSSFAPLICI